LRKLRIALLAPFDVPIPPPRYGGTERIIYSLAEELVKLGHDVTLLASGDSKTSARLIPCVEKSLWSLFEDNQLEESQRTMYWMEWQGFHRAIHYIRNRRFDIIHNHGDWPFLVAGAFTHVPIITTIHNPVQYKFGVKEVYKRYQYISISNAERNYLPDLDYVATIYNGIDIQDLEFNKEPGDYLAYLGRMDPYKGPE